MTARIAITMISMSKCCLLRSILGSDKETKCWIKLDSILSVIFALLIAAQSESPWNIPILPEVGQQGLTPGDWAVFWLKGKPLSVPQFRKNLRCVYPANGTEFRFLKLTKQDTPKYAQSYLFALDSRDDLSTVLKILKRLSQLVSQ